MTISYWLAMRLVWGVVEVGARSFCPEQTDAHGRSCVTADCGGTEAQCVVTEVRNVDGARSARLERWAP